MGRCLLASPAALTSCACSTSSSYSFQIPYRHASLQTSYGRRVLAPLCAAPAGADPQPLEQGVPAPRQRSSFLFLRPQEQPETVTVQQKCPECNGQGTCTCKDCGGSGRLKRGGYNKKNRVDLTRLYGKHVAVKLRVLIFLFSS